MIKVDARGDACPIPVVKTKKAVKELTSPDIVEILVDNEIAVQNLEKMAQQKHYPVKSEKLREHEFRVELKVTTIQGSDADAEIKSGPTDLCETGTTWPTEKVIYEKKKTVVVISGQYMGSGDDALGAVLMKGFIYAISQQEELPQTILFYNGGAKLTCEDAPVLEDLKAMEEQGVEILTCGTCLNHYGLADKLKVGTVTNMYVIAEKMAGADLLVRP